MTKMVQTLDFSRYTLVKMSLWYIYSLGLSAHARQETRLHTSMSELVL